MKTLWDGLIDLVFPPKGGCPFCGAGAPAAVVCASCQLVLKGYRQETRCRVCGRLAEKAATAARRAYICPECRGKPRSFVQALAPGPYEGILKEAVHRLKYGGERHLAAPLAGLMVEQLKEAGFFATGLDLLLPAPLAYPKLLRRGFNQAALLAQEISRRTAIPVQERVLAKTTDTPSQTGLPKAARAVNLRGVFKVTNQQTLQAKRILVVDDVFTTGSTVSEIAAVVRQAGADQVFVVTAATARC